MRRPRSGSSKPLMRRSGTTSRRGRRNGNIEKFVAAVVVKVISSASKKLMEGCEVNPNASAKPAAFKNNGQEDHGCALDTYIEQDKQLAKQIPVTQTPTSVITAKSQRYPAMPGFVTWPILKTIFGFTFEPVGD